MKQRLALALMILCSTIASLVLFSQQSGASEPIVKFAGDIDGSLVTQTVTGIKGKPVPTLAVGALSYDGGSWYFGTSGGVSPGTAGQALFTNDAGAATVWAYPHGDVDASATDPGALTVNAIQGFGVSTSVPSSTNVLAYSSGLWRPTALTTANITPGTAGQVMVSNGTPAAAWTSLISYETTHGRLTSGGSGTDWAATFGPVVGSETSRAGIWLLPNGTAPSGSNPSIQYITGNGLASQLQSNADLFSWSAPFGTIAAFSTSAWFVNGTTGAAPLQFNFSTATTPFIQSGTSATSFTLGTNRAAATLTLAADAVVSNIKLSAATATANRVDFLSANASSQSNIVTDNSGSVTWTAPTGSFVISATSAQAELDLSNTSQLFSNALNLESWAGTKYLQWNSSASTLKLGNTALITSLLGATDAIGIAAPAAPAASSVRIYADSADGKLKAMDPSGNIFVLAP